MVNEMKRSGGLWNKGSTAAPDKCLLVSVLSWGMISGWFFFLNNKTNIWVTNFERKLQRFVISKLSSCANNNETNHHKVWNKLSLEYHQARGFCSLWHPIKLWVLGEQLYRFLHVLRKSLWNVFVKMNRSCRGFIEWQNYMKDKTLYLQWKKWQCVSRNCEDGRNNEY